MKITITKDIELQRISDLLCCALEGGSNYWYMIEAYKQPMMWDFDSNETEGKHYAQDYPLNAGGALKISDMEDDDKIYWLNMDAIKKGLQVMADKFPVHFGDFLGEDEDAATGDIFLQCCLFGDIIYG